MIAVDPPRIRLVPADERPPSHDVADDTRLVERARTGETTAQAALFRRHAPRLLPMLVHLLASRADAEDVIQDAFVAAFRDVSQLKDSSAFGGWLRRIAVHLAHRRFRRRRLLGALGLENDGSETLERLVHPDAHPDVRAELAIIDRVLRKLPTKDRVAWMLRCVEGYELAEVADACACSLATAKRRVGAAQARIVKHVQLSELAND